ncbi:MAG: OB-fold domain-containing protein [Acidobacteriota bacterium]
MIQPEPVEELNKQYWSHCAAKRLCFQRCNDCGGWRHIPRPICAECGSTDWEWTASCGRGKVFSWTVTHAPLHMAFASQVPYAVIIVELEEGVRMLSGLKNCPVDEVELDMPVEVVFESLNETAAIPFFQPVDDAKK